MPYSVQALAKIAGVSVRTLHHYDEIKLLSLERQKNGYRFYGEPELLEVAYDKKTVDNDIDNEKSVVYEGVKCRSSRHFAWGLREGTREAPYYRANDGGDAGN